MKLTTKDWFFLIFIIAAAAGLLHTNYLNKRIKRNHFVTCADILEFYNAKGGGLLVKYKFVYNNKEYRNKSGCKLTIKKGYENGMLSGLLVAGENNAPHNHVVLMSASDFSRFHISINDTAGLDCWWRWW